MPRFTHRHPAAAVGRIVETAIGTAAIAGLFFTRPRLRPAWLRPPRRSRTGGRLPYRVRVPV